LSLFFMFCFPVEIYDNGNPKYNKYEHFLQKQRPDKVAVFLVCTLKIVTNDEVPFFFVDNVVERFFVGKTS